MALLRPSVLSAAAAAAIVALTIVRAKTGNPTAGNSAFAAVFFVALIGIGAGVVAALAARARGEARATGWILASINVLLGLVCAGVFVAVAISNSE